MKFGPGFCAIALAFQLALPALALSVNEIALNHATAPIHTTELRATPLLIGHCTIWHRAQPQQKNAISG
jgi:hypothetical protein